MLHATEVSITTVRRIVSKVARYATPHAVTVAHFFAAWHVIPVAHGRPISPAITRGTRQLPYSFIGARMLRATPLTVQALRIFH